VKYGALNAREYEYLEEGTEAFSKKGMWLPSGRGKWRNTGKQKGSTARGKKGRNREPRGFSKGGWENMITGQK